MGTNSFVDKSRLPHGNGLFGMPRRLMLVLILLFSPLSLHKAAADVSPSTSPAKIPADHISSFVRNATVHAWNRGGFGARPELHTAAFSIATVQTTRSSTPLFAGRVLVACWVANKRISASAELYNPSTDTWLTAGLLTSSRDNRNVLFPRTKRMLVWAGIIIPF